MSVWLYGSNLGRRLWITPTFSGCTDKTKCQASEQERKTDGGVIHMHLTKKHLVEPLIVYTISKAGSDEW